MDPRESIENVYRGYRRRKALPRVPENTHVNNGQGLLINTCFIVVSNHWFVTAIDSHSEQSNETLTMKRRKASLRQCRPNTRHGTRHLGQCCQH
jgi:hypothetical protein